jgi:hypothetical protein
MRRVQTIGVLLALSAMSTGTTQLLAHQVLPATGSAPPLTGVRAVVASIQGNALTSTNAPLVDNLVRLRDARSGRITGSMRTDKAGMFSFDRVEPGSYIVELVGSDQRVLAASQILNVNAGETISAIIKLPFKLQPYAGVLGHTAASALLVTATAAATGVLASQVTGEPVSPRR